MSWTGPYEKLTLSLACQVFCARIPTSSLSAPLPRGSPQRLPCLINTLASSGALFSLLQLPQQPSPLFSTCKAA
jgi:hypothetical protein